MGVRFCACDSKDHVGCFLFFCPSVGLMYWLFTYSFVNLFLLVCGLRESSSLLILALSAFY